MHARLQALQRVALVYMAMKHAQALTWERAAASLREAELLIEQQKMQLRRLDDAGHEALNAGEHGTWQMHESQKQFTSWNAEGLVELQQRRKALMLEAAEEYKAGRMRLEQMESVLRDLQSKVDIERAHRAQRESDDRFLAQRWWKEGGAIDPPEVEPKA